MFITLHVLRAFLDTPLEHRKGRLPYIIVSFVMCSFHIVISSMDAAALHTRLFNSKGIGLGILLHYHSPARKATSFVQAVVTVASIFLVDGVLVRGRFSHPPPFCLTNYCIVSRRCTDAITSIAADTGYASSLGWYTLHPSVSPPYMLFR